MDASARSGGELERVEKLERSLSKLETTRGPDSLEAAEVCHELGRALTEQQDVTRARPYLERALTLRTKALGPEHVDTLRTRHALGLLLMEESDLAGAQKALEDVLGTAERVLGPRSGEAAEVRTSLASCRLERGSRDKALPLVEHALEVHRAAPAAELEVARDLHVLARVLQESEETERARSCYAQATAILEKSSGADAPALARVLIDHSTLLRSLGEQVESYAMAERALSIAKRAYGPDRLGAARALLNMGVNVVDRAEYARSKELLERVIAMLRARKGREPLELPRALTELARNLIQMGDLQGARSDLEEALALWGKLVPPDHPGVRASLNQLARVLIRVEDYDAVIALRRREISIIERVYGKQHDYLSSALWGLAEGYRHKGDLARAKPLVERGLAIAAKHHGPDSQRVGLGLGYLGALQWSMHRNREACKTFERLCAIYRRNLGPDHPELAQALWQLGIALWTAGDIQGAVEKGIEAEECARRHFRETSRGLSEREAIRFGQRRQTGLEILLAGAARSEGPRLLPGTLSRILDQVVRSRAMVLDEMVMRQQATVADETPAVQELRGRLSASRARLSKGLVRDPQSAGSEARQRELAEIREEVDRDEKALVAASSLFRREQEASGVRLEDVVRAMPGDSTLVSFARYWADDTEAAYVVFVQAPHATDPIAVRLGFVGKIDALVERWRSLATEPPASGPAGVEAEVQYRAAAALLRQAIWDPIEGALGTAKLVFIVPDGSLNLVNFSALPAKAGGYLLESGRLFHLLSAERDLVPESEPHAPGKGLLLVGGPDYESSPAASCEQAQVRRVGAIETAADGLRAASIFGSFRFASIPRAAEEVREIKELWQQPARRGEIEPVLTLEGAAACEATFKELAPRYRIVHLATHGIFYDREATVKEARPGARAGTSAKPGQAGFSGSDHPLLLSGLALAGANRRDEARSDQEDGILTAEEIATLDLTGVDWAVLSGCETGVGTILPSEGILGLRRAFRIAGARTLIMSLWRVKDDATRYFMDRLYESRAAGASAPQSIQDASLAILDARRHQGAGTHPFYWGAWVSAGSWK